MNCEKCKYAIEDGFNTCATRCEICKYSKCTIDDEPCKNCCENDCRFEKR